MSELIRLSPLKDDVELEAVIGALRRGAAVVLPGACGLVVAQNADVEGAPDNVRRLAGTKPYLTLPSQERFERIFTKHPSPLLDWIAMPMRERSYALRLPHGAFERGLALRFAHHGSVIARLIEGAKVPVWTAVFPPLKGKPLGAMAAMARLGSLVDFVLDDPFAGAPQSLIEGSLQSAGLALRVPSAEAIAPRSIHFVCLGNLNRSAFAHYWLERQIEDERRRVEAEGMVYLPAWRVSSSGIIAREGISPPQGMISAARAWGLEGEFAAHLSQPFSLLEGRNADWLVPMSADVRDALAAYGLREKLVNFRRLGEISDPMGGNLDEYVETANAVETMLLKKVLSPACPL